MKVNEMEKVNRSQSEKLLEILENVQRFILIDQGFQAAKQIATMPTLHQRFRSNFMHTFHIHPCVVGQVIGQAPIQCPAVVNELWIAEETKRFAKRHLKCIVK